MCGPALLPALAIASAVVTAGGQVYGGLARANQAKYEAKIADQNATLASQQAADAQERGARDQLQHGRKLAQLKGQQQAAMAANGIDAGFGSALTLQEDAAMIGAEDQATIFKNTERETKGFEINAANYRSSAAAGRSAASAALVGTAFDVAGTALGGATQYGKLKAKG